MKPTKRPPLPKKLREEIIALAAKVRETAQALDTARGDFRKAKTVLKSAKIATRKTRKSVKAAKKEFGSLQDALGKAEKKASKWMRKHSREPGRRKATRAAKVLPKKPASARPNRRKAATVSKPRPIIVREPVTMPVVAGIGA